MKKNKQSIPLDVLGDLYKKYKEGMSIPELSELYDLVASTILRSFKRNGFTLKTKEERNKEKSLKIVKTNLERYGVKNVAQLKSTQEKMQATMLARHGVCNPAHSDEIKKIKKTNCLNKYGTQYFFQSDEFKDKNAQTMLLRYGVEKSSFSDEIISKRSNTKISNRAKRLEKSLLENGYELLDTYCGNREYIEGNPKWRRYSIRHKCGFTFSDDVFMLPRCPQCFPLNTSIKERAYADYITDLGFENISTRNIIYPYEIDIYIPELKIGFEYNGIFYHNNLRNHELKTDLCLDKGVKLYHIWEYVSDEIIKSNIKKILGISKMIDAKNTCFREITLEETGKFFEQCNLYTSEDAFLSCGLFFEDELISAIIYKLNEDNIEINFCDALNTQVNDALPKLLREGIRLLPKKKLIAYTDRDWCPDWRDSVYHKHGWIFEKNCGPSMIEVKNLKIWNSGNFKFFLPLEE